MKTGSEPSPALDSASIRAQLERILASEPFQHSRRYPTLLRHVVEHSLAGTGDGLKERTLGITVFKRQPEYDTSADPVVRTTASEIRKRLEEYYSDPSHAGELRIALPVGTYVPQFQLPNHDRTPSVSLMRRPRIWVMAVLLLIAAGFGATIRVYSRANPLDRFWEPILDTSPVLVVAETWVVPSPPSPQPAAAMGEPLDPQSFLLLNEINSKIAAYFGANRKTVEYELARNVTLAKLRTRPFVLRGAFNNPLTLQAVSAFRYYLNLDRASRSRQIVDRQDPSKHWDSPLGTLSRDYALIARAPDPRTGQMMVVIAGLGERGTAAAVEFLTNPKYMKRFAKQAPRGWEGRNLEIVLETQLASNDWGEPQIVVTHVW